MPDRSDRDDGQPLKVGRIEQLWPTPASTESPGRRGRPRWMESKTDNDPFLKPDRFDEMLKRDPFKRERDKK